MALSILDFFPEGLTPRDQQRDLLLQVEHKYHTSDVIVIQMPTAAGKTAVQVTIARWLAAMGHSSNLLQPTNVLLQQLLDKHPEIQSLHRKDAYHCEKFDRGCGVTKEKCGRHCSDCPYVQAKSLIGSAKVRAMNYYTYWAHKEYAHTLLMDEGHQVVDMLADKRDVKLWKSQYNFPSGMRTVTDVVVWAQEYLSKQRDANLARALRDILRLQDEAVIEYNTEYHRGKSQQVLHVCPTTSRWMPPWLWPQGKVKKLILLSATISPHDIDELGLARRRVTYLQCDSPIPPDRRRVFYEPVANMTWQNLPAAVPKIAAKIRELSKRHPTEKGLVHLPYSVAKMLRSHLDMPNVIWRDRENKKEALERFMAASPDSGAILIASDLYEGLDLPEDLARWQVIAKVPFLSLGSERVRFKAENDPDWYAWQAIKKLMQAAGRVCRTPEDKGTTYLLDRQFMRLWNEDRRRPENRRLFLPYFRQALIFSNT